MERFISDVESLIHVDAGERQLHRIFEKTKSELGDAARSLAGAKRVLIASGCFVPFGAPESDGPLGAAALAKVLVESGVQVDFVTDPECAAVFEKIVKYLESKQMSTKLRIFPGPARQETLMKQSAEGTGPVREAAETFARLSAGGAVDAWNAFLSDFLARGAEENAAYTHLVAIERLGAAVDGRFLSATAADISEHTGPIDRLFEYAQAAGITTIGIGDSGNEIGMGKVRDIVAEDISHGAQIACVTACKYLICSGVSNWGAYALAACMAVLNGGDSSAFSYGEESFLLEEISTAGAVDGITGTSSLGSIRGLERGEYHLPVLVKIRKAAENARSAVACV
mmetsp:Transcript_2381/g.7111  ORF Transcript_2381/g.7111 Transcript_2381/m.7111 type:complete len:341 (-) Transcript_2381:338-1360(-)|eukprot:CAMPEP_0198731336 /NCGR_PEP_ID=MMETSP1475-20131203/29233_1 /TAXON_ID= ORGANISM="Unidentified sp., Strain CCMP1999" /NCGR_SAMPLE_ID=MMETSP1475 /ASSEMBLY_ACC=CAM_ASM_001111 /LENGTH=340 /DNA_ID=CAMNT_0044494293 /DNA_START=119 /DNA_END=1141 /DNA_ORIENTATION=+